MAYGRWSVELMDPKTEKWSKLVDSHGSRAWVRGHAMKRIRSLTKSGKTVRLVEADPVDVGELEKMIWKTSGGRRDSASTGR